MRRKVCFTILLAVIFAFSTPWCAAADEIVIGYSGPLSGPAAEYGQDCVNGIDMAISEINHAGGVVIKGRTYTFRLERMDDRIDPKVSLNNARQMRQAHKVIAIFNPVTNTIASMMSINEEKKNEFLIMAYSSVPQISESGNKLLIAVTTPFTTYVRTEADLAWEKGWRKCAMVVTMGAYGEGWRKAFAEEWIRKGGMITADKPANYYKRTEFAAPLQEALGSNPDFLLIGGPSATTAMIISQARARGFEGGFVMTDQVNLDTVYQLMEKPLSLEGSIGVSMVSHISYPASGYYHQTYKMNYKRNPTWESIQNYMGMHALAKAMSFAGVVDDARAIRAAFPKVFPMLGDQYPAEVYGLSAGGRFIISSSIQTIKYGKITPPNNYVWWAKTAKEFEQIRKITKSNIAPIWKMPEEK